MDLNRQHQLKYSQKFLFQERKRREYEEKERGKGGYEEKEGELEGEWGGGVRWKGEGEMVG